MPAKFDKEAYKAVCDEVRRNMAAMRWQSVLLMTCMKALLVWLRVYRGVYFWHDGDRESMRALSAEMAADLQKLTRLVNDTRKVVATYIEQAEDKRQAAEDY